ncbi:MAG TPA: nucleotidyltransferase family protein [Spirochaetia bacterium]|nr:nucleotidyltransferase family protein [Spirochaetia bacterium]
MLSAIILAAGRSSRMGGAPKALMTIGKETFLERIVGELQGCGIDEMLIVLGARSEEILRQEETWQRIPVGASNIPIKILVNDEWETGQLSSLRTGIRNLSAESEGVLFTLVDHPLTGSAAYKAVIDAWRQDRKKIVVPTFRGRRGHPTVFPRRLYRKVLDLDLPNGARDILRLESDSVVLVPVDDPGIVTDIDTPEDYRKILIKE